jgi:hypothetical protein
MLRPRTTTAGGPGAMVSPTRISREAWHWRR